MGQHRILYCKKHEISKNLQTHQKNQSLTYLLLLFFLNFISTGFANCRDVFPVYIGDDKTDEDAFKVHIDINIYTHNV